MTAFLFMAKQTVIAETHPAERAIELLTMKNFVPAFAAFDSSIDQLKHPMFIPTILVINTSVCRQALRDEFLECSSSTTGPYHDSVNSSNGKNPAGVLEVSA
jgi:hypothetical protein